MRPAKAARVGGILLPVLALAAVLVFSGCGGGDSSSATETTGVAATTGETDQSAGGNAKQDESSSDPSAQSSGEEQDSDGSRVPRPEGEPESGITPQQRRKATTASMTLASPSFAAGAALPVKYTCDGEDESPPLQWSGQPDDTAELVLFVLNMTPVNEALFFNWAVAGLDPSLKEIEGGKLPLGAVEGKNSFGKRGYSLCPPEERKPESYIFMLYAIPEEISPEPGFDPLPLREAVLKQSGNVGLLNAFYKRR